MGEETEAAGSGSVSGDASDKADEWTISPAIAAGIGVVVAALAAVGVSGDVLTRAVRNEPGRVAALFIAALAVVGFAAGLALLKKRQWLFGCATLVLVTIAVAAVWSGADSLTDRERPSAVLSAKTAEGITTITIQTKASGLRSDESVLTRVVALRRRLPVNERDLLCVASSSESTADGEVIVWQEAGPNSDGEVDVTISVEVAAAEYTAACSYVALADRNLGDPSDNRLVRGYLVLGGSGG